MLKSKSLIMALALILLAGNFYFGVKYLAVQSELRQAQALLTVKTTNDKVVEFTKLFVEKVLKARTEIDFETRLNLENAVRNLKDKEILAQWQKFTDSQTEAEAQTQVKDLLDMLVNKIKL